MVPSRKKPGPVSQFIKPIKEVLDGKRPYIPFRSRSKADNCATYFKGHYIDQGSAHVRSEDGWCRVYIEKGVQK